MRALSRYMNIFNLNNERSCQTTIIKHERARIVQLPNELLLLIRSFLSLISQACLALTCKTLFRFTGEILHSPEFNLPPWERKGLGWKPSRSLRWELLCLLEDARWLLCPHCIKLHPSGTFREGMRSAKSRASRACFYGPCAVGIVEICPCLRLTFGDKLKLVAQLESSRQEACIENSSCWHECLTVRGTETVLIRAQPVLQKDGNLVFQMRYEVRTSHRRYDFLENNMPIFCCCFVSIHQTPFELQLDDRRPSLIWTLQSPGSHHTRRCRLCKTTVGDPTLGENANEKYYTFQVTRNLGNGRKYADQTWSSQCGPLASNVVENEEERERKNQKSNPSDVA